MVSCHCGLKICEFQLVPAHVESLGMSIPFFSCFYLCTNPWLPPGKFMGGHQIPGSRSKDGGLPEFCRLWCWGRWGVGIVVISGLYGSFCLGTTACHREILASLLCLCGTVENIGTSQEAPSLVSSVERGSGWMQRGDGLGLQLFSCNLSMISRGQSVFKDVSCFLAEDQKRDEFWDAPSELYTVAWY